MMNTLPDELQKAGDLGQPALPSTGKTNDCRRQLCQVPVDSCSPTVRESMMGLGIDEYMVAWTPVNNSGWTQTLPGAVEVGPCPDRSNWSKPYLMTGGCCEARFVAPNSIEAKAAMMFILFNTLVVRDGIDPQAAHAQFLKIDEYCKLIAPDTPGAKP